MLLLTLASVGQVVVSASLAPSPSLLGRLCLAAAGAALPLSLGLAALTGVAGGIARLRVEGALLALLALGHRESRLGAYAAVWTLPFALVWLVSAHFTEPLARAAVRDIRAEAAAGVLPNDHRTVHVGGWYFAVDGDRLRFTDGVTIGDAGQWHFSTQTGGVLVELAELAFQRGDVAVTATIAALPIPIASRNKPHPSERTTPDLLDQLEKSARLGRDPYERWMLWKRTVLPVSLAPLASAAAGFARRSLPGWVVGGLLFFAWGAVRVLDGTVGVVGAGGSACFFLGLCTSAALAGWRKP